MASAVREHIDELIRAAEGRKSGRDGLIASSWVRCMSNHGLDPAVLRPPVIVPEYQLREHRDAMDDLLRRARFGVEALYRQVAGLGYILLLTDNTGITVDYIGDSTATDELKAAGLYLGFDWSETKVGTNGVGTCIATSEALVVHKTDHFDGTHIPLTCTAAPIFDATGNLAAVLDVAALTSPDDKSSQLLALQVVKTFAHRIETANLISSNRRNWIIKLTSTQEFAEVETEFVLAIDSGGRIVGFNHMARQMLMREQRLDWRKAASIQGRLFSDYFDCDIDRLTDFVHSTGGLERNFVRLRDSKKVLFLQVSPPQGIRVRAIQRIAQSNLPAPLLHVAGEDKALQTSLQRLAKLINVNLSFLIQGETGTGKEFIAKAIHAASVHAHGPFVPVNCAALPEALIESELFGYEAGSFTGATAKGKKGLIREAHGGTIFLDEIGDMPLTSQTRLLRVLSEREVTPVGGARPTPVDIRVISATHCDLKDLVKAGKFREDLYFRLNGAVLSMPALRKREDFDWLVMQLLQKKCENAPKLISADALAAMRQYQWPGNIRELVNVIDYACALCDGNQITPDDLPAHIFSGTEKHEATSEEEASLRNTLKLAQWNISAAARLIGIDRTTMHRRMRKYGIMLPPRSD